ncbi:MAG: TrmJ/YjtD family RNA methyltransferase [Thermofilaceae archaeon]
MRLNNVSVAFVEPLYEINVGYVARCMKNFGLTRLILVKPRCRIGDEAYRFSAHAQDVLANARIVDDLAQLRREFDLIVGTTGVATRDFDLVRRWIPPDQLARRIAEQEGKVLLVLGREDIGLTNEELSLCDIVSIIPANPEYPIMNVSHAAAVFFYEIYKQTVQTAPAWQRERMPRREELEVLLRYLKLLLLELGEREDRAERACLMMKRLLGGATPTDADVRMLLGALRGAYERIQALKASERPQRI